MTDNKTTRTLNTQARMSEKVTEEPVGIVLTDEGQMDADVYAEATARSVASAYTDTHTGLPKPITVKELLTILNVDPNVDPNKINLVMDQTGLDILHTLRESFASISSHVETSIYQRFTEARDTEKLDEDGFASIGTYYIPVDKNGDIVTDPNVTFSELSECTYRAYHYKHNGQPPSIESYSKFIEESEINPEDLKRYGVAIRLENAQPIISRILSTVYDEETGEVIAESVEPVLDLMFSGHHGGKLVAGGKAADVHWDLEKFEKMKSRELDGEIADKMQEEAEAIVKGAREAAKSEGKSTLQ